MGADGSSEGDTMRNRMTAEGGKSDEIFVTSRPSGRDGEGSCQNNPVDLAVFSRQIVYDRKENVLNF